MEKESNSDVINAVLGVVLFLSPWMLGYSPDTTATWNAWLSGIAIVVLAVAALTVFAEWEEWLSLLAGLWVLVSPWVLNFAPDLNARWVHVVIGAVVAIIAVMRIWVMRQRSSV